MQLNTEFLLYISSGINFMCRRTFSQVTLRFQIAVSEFFPEIRLTPCGF